MRSAIADAGLPVDAVQFVDSTDRQDVATLLQQSKFVDVIIPRGGKSLIKAVSENTKIPVIKHYDGICHQYVAEDPTLRWRSSRAQFQDGKVESAMHWRHC